MQPCQYFMHLYFQLSARAFKFSQYVISMVLCFFWDTMYTGVPVYVSILNYAKCAHFSTSETIPPVLCGYTLDTCTVYKLDKKEHIVHTQIQDMHDRTQSICSIILHHRHAHRTQSIGNTTYKRRHNMSLTLGIQNGIFIIS